MKNAVQLYEFMPYGAPELLESRQRHMGQALVLTCAAFLLLYALLGSLAPLIGAQRVVPTIASVDILPDVNRTQIERMPAPPPLTPRIHDRAPDIGISVPAPVPDVPIEVPAPPGTTTTGPAGPVGPAEAGSGTSAKEVPPSPDVFVYVEQLPAVVREVKPIYPDIAWRAGIEGLVMVKVLVGKDGRVQDVLLVDTVQVPMLNDAALTAARQWVFTPGLDNGRPVACWTVIPFRFRLH